MPSRLPDFILRMLAEGTAAEKVMERSAVHKEARELAAKMPMPPDKQAYVGNLLGQAFKGELDIEVFKEFVKLTNTHPEVERVATRIRMLMRKEV